MPSYFKLAAAALAASLPLTLAFPQFGVLPITAAGVEATTSSPTAPPSLTIFNLAAPTTTTAIDPVESFKSSLSSFSTNSLGSFRNLASSSLPAPPNGFEEAMKASSSVVIQGPGPVVTALPEVVGGDDGIAAAAFSSTNDILSPANDVLDADRSVGHVVKLVASDGQVFDLPLEAAVTEAIGDGSVFVEMPFGVSAGSRDDDTAASSITEDGVPERATGEAPFPTLKAYFNTTAAASTNEDVVTPSTAEAAPFPTAEAHFNTTAAASTDDGVLAPSAAVTAPFRTLDAEVNYTAAAAAAVNSSSTLPSHHVYGVQEEKEIEKRWGTIGHSAPTPGPRIGPKVIEATPPVVERTEDEEDVVGAEGENEEQVAAEAEEEAEEVSSTTETPSSTPETITTMTGTVTATSTTTITVQPSRTAQQTPSGIIATANPTMMSTSTTATATPSADRWWLDLDTHNKKLMAAECEKRSARGDNIYVPDDNPCPDIMGMERQTIECKRCKARGDCKNRFCADTTGKPHEYLDGPV